MARTTYVKKAQQRYATVPVIDPETGQQKQTPVMKTVRVRQEDGSYVEETRQKTTKHGRPVFMKVTRSDKSQPLPNRTCEKCSIEIEVGQPYKHITPKSGPYGGRTRFRCGKCPNWQVWEYSNSLSAQIERVTTEAYDAIDSADDADEVSSALSSAAEGIRELAEEKREAAQNMEDGFGHSTSQSEELAEQADSLDSWADDIENADVPDFPEPEEQDCEECGGSGEVKCSECSGEGSVTPDEPTDEQIDQWRDEVRDNSCLEDCPV